MLFRACISVDGLVKCNEQISKDGMANNKSSNGSEVRDHNHMVSNFPFLDGSLFTTTIWAGEEGFHATVNGRHETSFVYREVRYDGFQAILTLFDVLGQHL